MRSKNLSKIALVALLNALSCGEEWEVNTNHSFLTLAAKIPVPGYQLDIDGEFESSSQGRAKSIDQLKGHILAACLFCDSAQKTNTIRDMLLFARHAAIDIPEQREYVIFLIDGQAIRVPLPPQPQEIRDQILRMQRAREVPGVAVLDLNKADLKLNNATIVPEGQLFQEEYKAGGVSISLSFIPDESCVPALTAACLLSDGPLSHIIRLFQSKQLALPTSLPKGNVVCVFNTTEFNPSKACILTNRQSQQGRQIVEEALNITRENSKTGVLYLDEGRNGAYYVKKCEYRDVPQAIIDALPRDSLEFRAQPEVSVNDESPIDKILGKCEPGNFYEAGYCEEGERYRYPYIFMGHDGSNRIVLFVNGILVRSSIVPMIHRDNQGLVTSRDDPNEVPGSNALAFLVWALYQYEGDEIHHLQDAMDDGVFDGLLRNIQECLEAGCMYVRQGTEIRKIGSRTLNEEVAAILGVGAVQQGSHLTIEFNQDLEPSGFELTKLNPMPDVKQFDNVWDWDSNPSKRCEIIKTSNRLEVKAPRISDGHVSIYKITDQIASHFADNYVRMEFRGMQLVCLLAWYLATSDIKDGVIPQIERILSPDEIQTLKTMLKHNVYRSDNPDSVYRNTNRMSAELIAWIAGKAAHPIDCIIYFQNGVPQRFEWVIVEKTKPKLNFLRDNVRATYISFLTEQGVRFDQSDDSQVHKLYEAVSLLVVSEIDCSGKSADEIDEMFRKFKEETQAQLGRQLFPDVDSEPGDMQIRDDDVSQHESTISSWEWRTHDEPQDEEEQENIGNPSAPPLHDFEDAPSIRGDSNLEDEGDRVNLLGQEGGFSQEAPLDHQKDVGIPHECDDDEKSNVEEEYAADQNQRTSWFNGIKCGFRIMVKWVFFGWFFNWLFGWDNQ